MNENQINRDLCIEILVNDNYDYDDAVAIVDEVINFKNNYSGIDMVYENIFNTDMVSMIMESDTLAFLLDENSTYQELSKAYKIAEGITNAYGVTASLSDIAESNANGLPADPDSLGGFLSSFLDTVNLLSGEVTGIDVLTDETLEAIQDGFETYSVMANRTNFTYIFNALPYMFKENNPDIYSKLMAMIDLQNTTLDMSDCLSLEQLDIISEYCKSNYPTDYENVIGDGITTYDEIMIRMKEYTEDRIVYELNQAIGSAGVTPEQFQQEINDFNNILKDAKADRNWNIFWDNVSKFNPFDDDESESESGFSGGGSTGGSRGGGFSGTRYSNKNVYNNENFSNGPTNISSVFLNKKISSLLVQSELSFGQVQATNSPLVVDVDGNGFETKAKTDGVYFDLDNNGFAEKTAWTSGDAFLTYDLNENGKIDNGGELFGNHTLVGENKAVDGFAALAQYDDNLDGFIDENDEIYHLMRLWNDDGDGVSEDGEFDEDILAA
jgi:hypothetical protein